MRLKKKNLHLNQEIEQHYSFRKLASGAFFIGIKTETVSAAVDNSSNC